MDPKHYSNFFYISNMFVSSYNQIKFCLNIGQLSFKYFIGKSKCCIKIKWILSTGFYEMFQQKKIRWTRKVIYHWKMWFFKLIFFQPVPAEPEKVEEKVEEKKKEEKSSEKEEKKEDEKEKADEKKEEKDKEEKVNILIFVSNYSGGFFR